MIGKLPPKLRSALLILTTGITPVWSNPTLATDPSCAISHYVRAAKLQREFEKTQSQFYWVSPLEMTQYTKHHFSIIRGETIDIEHPAASRYQIKRKDGLTWESAKLEGVNAPQGDPRAFVQILGTDIGEVFGFEMSDANTLLVPSVARFRHRLNQLKDAVHELEELPTFYVTHEGKISTTRYLQRFEQEGALPWSETDPMLGHDIAVHAPAISLPPRYFQHARKQVRLFLAFQKYLQEVHPEFTQANSIEIELLGRLYGVALDAGTGNFSILRRQQKIYPDSVSWGQVYESGPWELTQAGRSPLDCLSAHISQLNRFYAQQSPVQKRETPKKTLTSLLDQFIKTLSRAQTTEVAIPLALPKAVSEFNLEVEQHERLLHLAALRVRARAEQQEPQKKR